MGLRKGLGALVALLVIGALAAGASAATAATATAKSKPKHKPAPARKKLHVCSIGQKSGPGGCLANPLYAKTACDAWTPKVEALVGGPAQVSPAGNPSSFATGIVCQWRAGDELARIQGGTALGEVPLTISFSVGSLGTTTATAAEFRTNLKHIQDAVAMPLSELQKDFETNATLWETPCYVQDPPGAVDHVIPFDPPHMLSGLGDLAYS